MEPAPELGWNDFLSQVQPGANVVLGDSSLDLVDFCGSDVQDPLPEVGSKQCHVSGRYPAVFGEHFQRGQLDLAHRPYEIVVTEDVAKILGLVSGIARQGQVFFHFTSPK